VLTQYVIPEVFCDKQYAFLAKDRCRWYISITFSSMSSRHVGGHHSQQIPFKNLFTQNPGFSRDRGPVQVYSLRLRLSY
jgi:hypothetical protein